MLALCNEESQNDAMPEFHSPRQELTSKVFARAHQLEIWGTVLHKEIEPPELFTGTEIYDEVLDLSETPHPTRSMVLGELRELNKLKMIARLSPKRTRNIPLFRLDHPLWSIVEFAVPVINSIDPYGDSQS